jgi:hypothetical protein
LIAIFTASWQLLQCFLSSHSNPRGEHSNPRGEHSNPRGEHNTRSEQSNPRGEHNPRGVVISYAGGQYLPVMAANTEAISAERLTFRTKI